MRPASRHAWVSVTKSLSELNPRLIYCSLSGYGQDGPYRDVKAYDLLIQGEGGIIATTGYPDKPARAGIAIADIASGMYAAIGILLALYQREKTGEGQIDRRFDAGFDRFLARLFSASLLARRRRAGARRHAPSLRHSLRPLSCRRRGICESRGGERSGLGGILPKVIEKPEFLEDPRFASVEARRKNRGLLEETIENIFLHERS